MKVRSSIFVALLLGILTLGAFYPQVDDKQREMVILDAIVHFINMAHFQPKEINDDFSKETFKSYINSIDPAKRFLTQAEVDMLKPYELQLDDQIKEKSFEFFDKSVGIIDAGMVRAKTYYEEAVKEDFNFEEKGIIELDSEKKPFAANDTELKKYWSEAIKYEVLTRLYRSIELQNDKSEESEKSSAEETEEEMNSEPVVQKSIEELKVEAIEDTKEIFDDWFDRMSLLRRSDRFEAYINAITHNMDPHSDYFNPKEKQDFDINMGGKLEGIGARLQTDKGYTKVTSIIAGGPAWVGKDLEVNDLIFQVAQAGEDPVDITGMRLDDVVQLIRGKKGTVVTLTVKKTSGDTQDVQIERDIVQIEDTFAKSLLLDIPGSVENIGYIKLPKFYSSFEKKDGNSCAVDVAKEIEKLNQENVNGIILDLRSNGGGSLRDVVDMSGLFIDKGPIVQVKPRDKAPYVYKDRDAETRYDGPLVVMVNSFSASASEILAAALQDYNRAVIVGSTSTFGKGTVQRFFDLDDAVLGNNELKPLGEVKLTMQKFYRVDGGSTQLKGVVPDVILPDNYLYIETGEKDYEHAMEWTKIDPVAYDQKSYNISNKPLLIAESNERIAKNANFQLMKENAARLKANRDISQYPMNLEDFSAMMEKREKETEKFDVLFKDELGTLEARNLTTDVAKIEADEVAKDTNKDWKEAIKKDFYLEEALHIIKDMKKG